MPKKTEAATEAPAKAVITRDIKLPKEFIMLMKASGVVIPGNVKEIETDVVTSDSVKQIVIPKGMSKLDAAEELRKQHQNEEQKIDIRADFPGWNWKDVLVAIRRTTESTFGWINGRTDYTWFGPKKPTEIDIVVDMKNGSPVIEKAFFNGFNVGPWEDANATVGVMYSEVSIVINAKRKYNHEVTEYFNAIRAELENNSIYRGRSIVVQKDRNNNLEFEIIENKANDIIILNHGTQLVIDNFVLGALPDGGKRTFLFTGNYGNGKTEIASRVGRIAVQEHGQSFFYVKDSDLFEQLLIQSKKYQPCIIFLEDIDEIASGEQRDNAMNSILNTLDGVQTKGNNLITIFTTNHPERINSALRRPGRIDLVVEFMNPDEEAKEIIMRRYFEGINGADNLNYKALAEFIPDVQGAVIAEICKRAVKLSSGKHGITDDLVMASVESMRYQIHLMKGESAAGNKYENFFKQFSHLMRLNNIEETVDEIRTRV